MDSIGEGLASKRQRFERDAVALRGRRWILAIGATFQLVGLALLGRYFFDESAHIFIAIAYGLSGIAPAALSIYAWSARKWPRRVPVHLVADGSGLRVAGRLVARETVAVGHLLAGSERVVRLVRKGRFSAPIDLELESPSGAAELLDALGLDIRRSTARFEAVFGGVRRRGLTGAFGAFVFLMLFLGMEILFHRVTGRELPPGLSDVSVMIPALLPLLIFGVWRTVIDVGADGVWLSRGNTFLSYAELAEARIEGQDLVLRRKRGRSIRLGFADERNSPNEARDACLQRIEQARAAFAAGTTTAHPEALLAPSGRSVGEWLRALRSFSDYRTPSLPDEALWRVVEDPTAAAPTRAAAAVALTRSIDDDVRKRLRVAALACAAPKLRVALELVAEEVPADETRLREALERVAKI